MKFPRVQTTTAFFTLASLVSYAEAADKSFMSVPLDTSIHKRAAIPEDVRPVPAFAPVPGQAVTSAFVVDAVVTNTDPTLRNDDTDGVRGEVSIGVGRPVQAGAPAIVLTHFDALRTEDVIGAGEERARQVAVP